VIAGEFAQQYDFTAGAQAVQVYAPIDAQTTYLQQHADDAGNDLLQQVVDSGVLLQNVQYLSCHNLKLIRLPDGLFQCTPLRYLALPADLLAAVPEQIGMLRELRMLNVYGPGQPSASSSANVPRSA
jgi:hypothetical protein